MNRKDLFERFFGSNISKGKLILSDAELSLASVVYDATCDEIYDVADDYGYHNYHAADSLASFDEKVEAVVHNFERVVELFKKTSEAKSDFLENFDRWSSIRKSNVRSLKEIAGKIQADKFNGDISKIVGGVVGAVGGVVVLASLFTSLAAVTIPLAIGGGVISVSGGTVIVGTVGTEIFLLKKRLKEAKNLVVQEQKNFSCMANWFIHSEELKKALESLVGYNLVNDLVEVVQEFLGEVTDIKELMVGNGKKKLYKVLELCIRKMRELSTTKETFGEVITPAVMTFVIVVGLLRVHNRTMLRYAVITHSLAIGLMSVWPSVDIGEQSSQICVEFAKKGTHAAVIIVSAAVTRISIMGPLVALTIAIDIINVILSSKDIHTRAQSIHANNVKEAADKLDKEFLFIEKVYNELKNNEL